jgi:hypothetical protein
MQSWALADRNQLYTLTAKERPGNGCLEGQVLQRKAEQQQANKEIA